MTSRADLIGRNVKCTYCGKGLRNFKVKHDWTTRKLHKECWKIQQTLNQVKEWVEEDKRRKEEDDKRWEMYRRSYDSQVKYIRELKEENNELKITRKQLQNSTDFYRNFATSMF